MMDQVLNPTMWRTCRTLANRVRLDVVQHLIKCPDQTVSCIARRLHIDLPHASRDLRALNARGLVGVERSGKWVRYRLTANPSIPWTKPLLNGVLKTFAERKQPCDLLFRQATAFTHVRRIEICRALLSEGPLDREHLIATCHISQPALSRHIEKLDKRGFLARKKDCWVCIAPNDPFSKALVGILSKFQVS